MSRTFWAFFFLFMSLNSVVVVSPYSESAAAQSNVVGRILAANGISVTLQSDGSFEVLTPQGWRFSGQTGGEASQSIQASTSAGADSIDKYSQLDFTTAAYGGRRNSIRVYADKAIVLLKATTMTNAANAPFVRFTQYPPLPYHFSYQHEGFAPYSFDFKDAHDSPWLFFNGDDRAFLLSPAAQFMAASTIQNADGSIDCGIESSIRTLPPGTLYAMILVVGSGINHVFNVWGNALTSLSVKQRVSNDADVTLRKLGYWTDNGANYYYKFDQAKGYEGTLLSIRDEFQHLGVPLGYMQLDSWFYGKGPHNDWAGRGQGMYEYRASPALFPDGLPSFQKKLGLPLATHARWIDPSSPYRSKYAISGSVAVDSRYWEDTMRYLHDAGVVMYEQDWLADRAVAAENLTDPLAFHNLMAAATVKYGMTMQYCGGDPRDFLDSSRLSNLTTMRVAGDRFKIDKWDDFLYASRLITAVGAWPWVDVFMSSETKNLLLATLSGGPVGVGDALGTEDAANLLQSVRADGTIVKPDTPFVPVDQSYIAEARDSHSPMVASASTIDGNLVYHYVFAYGRATGNSQIRFSPSQLDDNLPGASHASYVYDYFAKRGRLVGQSSQFEVEVFQEGSYYIVAPIGKSGMAFLGDLSQFVPVGRNRIAPIQDRGMIEATILFAPTETERTITVFARAKPNVIVRGGSLLTLRYDRQALLAYIKLRGSDATPVTVRIYR